jgi:hypothetical protein
MKYWPALAVVAVVVAGALFFWSRTGHPADMRTIHIDYNYFQVEVADTEALRERGLSGRRSLPAGQGMLFIFDAPGSWGIWMKDMRFSLDIMWAREDGTIITVVPNVSPDTYPLVLYPQTPDAKYVIEVPAGAAAGIAEGTKLVLE